MLFHTAGHVRNHLILFYITEASIGTEQPEIHAHVYNMDETGMPSDSRQLKKVAPKGLKKMYGSSSGNKIQITILAYVNGMGNVLPSMIIFNGKHFNHDWVKGEIPNTWYGMSPNG